MEGIVKEDLLLVLSVTTEEEVDVSRRVQIEARASAIPEGRIEVCRTGERDSIRRALRL